LKVRERGRSSPADQLSSQRVLADRGCAFAGIGGAEEWFVEPVAPTFLGGGAAELTCDLKRGAAVVGGRAGVVRRRGFHCCDGCEEGLAERVLGRLGGLQVGGR
jgi:hypothetical protein